MNHISIRHICLIKGTMWIWNLHCRVSLKSFQCRMSNPRLLHSMPTRKEYQMIYSRSQSRNKYLNNKHFLFRPLDSIRLLIFNYFKENF